MLLLKYEDADEEDPKMCLLKSFSSLLEASRRKSSFDYLIGCGKVCCNHNTSSRNRATIEGDGIFSYLRNFEKKKLKNSNLWSFVSNVIFT